MRANLASRKTRDRLGLAILIVAVGFGIVNEIASLNRGPGLLRVITSATFITFLGLGLFTRFSGSPRT